MEERILTPATRDVLCALSDESLREVLIRFNQGDFGHLPVVDPANPKRVVGVISRQHVVKTYNRALDRCPVPIVLDGRSAIRNNMTR